MVQNKVGQLLTFGSAREEVRSIKFTFAIRH
jgi:hypothetical protein